MNRAWPSDPRGVTPEARWLRELARVPRLDLSLLERRSEQRRRQEESARLIVVAAHPDDETLGAGGLIHTAAALGARVDVVVATAGEASHPHSPTHTPQQLAAIRRDEVVNAVAALAPRATVVQRDYPDGRLADHEDELVADLVRVIGLEGARTLVAAPWRGDRHPDHEGAGRAAALACRRTDAHLLEYPIWLWHWGRPADAPWPQLRHLALTAAGQQAKRDAAHAHASQVEPLSAHPDDHTLLPPPILERFERPSEVFVQAPLPEDDALEALHARDSDPWRTQISQYEIDKRAATCDALPRRRYRRALDIGCSIGLLSAELAQRADQVLAVDSSASALRTAAERVRRSNVTFARLHLPQQWPAGTFDLVVLSETGYFLSPGELAATILAVREHLAPDGVVVLCHWRHEIVGWPLDGAAVHAAFGAGLGPAARRIERVETRDYLLEVYANGAAR